MQELCVLHVTPYSGRRVGVWGHSPAVAGHGAQSGRPRPSGHHLHDRRVRRGLAGSKPARRARRVSPPGRRSNRRHGVTLRVFPNLSNRLAYHQQAFRADRPARVPPRARAVVRRGASARLPEPARRDRRRDACARPASPTCWRPTARPRTSSAGSSPSGSSMRPSGDDVTRTPAACWRHRGRAAPAAASWASRTTRIRLVPNPIDLQEFDSPAGHGRLQGAAIGLAGPLVAFLGKITPRKRVDLLIRAFAHLRTPEPRSSSPATTWARRSAARAAAREAGVGDRTPLRRAAARAPERLELLADADVVVYPSEHEIFGLVPLEALLAGTPVVVADDSGCGEVVRQRRRRPGRARHRRRAGRRHRHRAGAARDAGVNRPAAAAHEVRARFGADAVGAQLEDVVRRRHEDALSTQPRRASASSCRCATARRRSARRSRRLPPRTTAAGRVEIIVVDDGSDDGSRGDPRRRWPTCGTIRVLDGPAARRRRRGQLRRARGPLPDRRAGRSGRRARAGLAGARAGALRRPAASAPCRAATSPTGSGSLFSRVMALDLEQRYARLPDTVDHVCTGNTAYRVERAGGGGAAQRGRSATATTTT